MRRTNALCANSLWFEHFIHQISYCTKYKNCDVFMGEKFGTDLQSYPFSCTSNHWDSLTNLFFCFGLFTLVKVLISFVPASKMRLRRGLGYPTQITVPYVFTARNTTLKIKMKWDFCEAVIWSNIKASICDISSVPLNCTDESLTKSKWNEILAKPSFETMKKLKSLLFPARLKPRGE